MDNSLLNVETLQDETARLRIESENLLIACHNLRRERDNLTLKLKDLEKVVTEYIKSPQKPKQLATTPTIKRRKSENIQQNSCS